MSLSEIVAHIRDNPYHNLPQPLKRADDHEFMKTMQVTERLKTWCDGYAINGGVTQAIEDIKWLLADHLRLFAENRDKESDIWYQTEKSDNGNVSISWRERAEEMETRLNWLTKQFHDMKWSDAGPLSDLKPEDEKYIDADTLIHIIDERIHREPRP
jgi:hypothetical protein